MPGQIFVLKTLVGNCFCQLAFLGEKLMVGLEHAPPNFDVKSRLLGPAVSTPTDVIVVSVVLASTLISDVIAVAVYLGLSLPRRGHTNP